MKNKHFDIVLMDMQMPEMDGYTATKEYRLWEASQDKKDSLVIIALTAFALKQEHEKSIQAGCNEHVTKPVKKKNYFRVT